MQIDTRTWGAEFERDEALRQVDILLQQRDERQIYMKQLESSLRDARLELDRWLAVGKSARLAFDSAHAHIARLEAANDTLRITLANAHDHIVQLEQKLKRRKK